MAYVRRFHPLRIAAVLLSGIILTGAATVALPSMKITNVSIGSVTKDDARNKHLKGTMTFKVNGASKSLNAYHNLILPYARDCTELVMRYAATLGFAGYAGKVGANDDSSKLGRLGNGYEAAKKFAAASGGTFTYVTDYAAALPKPGAVLSTTLTTEPLGHVMIVGDHGDPGKATSISISVFEQNIPVDYFRTVVFTKQKNGTWHGTYYNKNVNNPIVGWANPKD